MLKPNNRIIIVDNEPEELIQLGKVFLENGLPCRTFEYDQFYNYPLENVRIAFFDIKLNPSGTEKEEQTFTTLADAIKLYISKNNSPYALIFWTNNSKLVNKFTKFVEERYDDVPSPFVVNCIDKIEVNGDSKILFSELEKILENPFVKILFDFEAKAYRASAQTISRILNIIPSNDKWVKAESFTKKIDIVFSQIAKSIFGKKHAIENPDKAVNEALLPMQNFFFHNQNNDTCWKDLLSKIGTKDLNLTDLSLWYKLNSVFHIDDNTDFDKKTRGGVVKLNISNDDFKIKFGKKIKGVIGDFIPFNDALCDKKNREEIRNNSEFLLIEISAACDYSNNSSGLNKYLLALKTPVFKHDLLNTQSQAVFKDLPVFYLHNAQFKIWVNFNYSFGLLPSNPILGEQQFILKGEIINQIGNRYANHISRIGITSF